MQWVTRYLGVSTVTSTKALSAAILISQSVLLHKRSLAARSTSFYPSLSFIYSELTNKVVEMKNLKEFSPIDRAKPTSLWGEKNNNEYMNIDGEVRKLTNALQKMLHNFWGAPATNACGVMEGASAAAGVSHDEPVHGVITADGPPLRRLIQQS
ncbi:hypothetical protein HID58_036305 [Brassica napus]|uniref:Uncharacterized protein n=1 Tax=Brassica napus TaxID=3708 RepID=A0ABQ8C7D1_BRANA|nr:hypothetical protein HID58_036305 [Brassica napus]